MFPILKTFGELLWHSTGPRSLQRWQTRRELRILMFHRVASPTLFSWHCRHLAENYSVVSMDRIAEAFSGGERLPDNALAITIDDGYLDSYEVMYPILRQHDLPATLFVATGFLDGEPLWGDRLKWMCQNSTAASVDFGSELGRVRVRSEEEIVRVWSYLRELPNEARKDWLRMAAIRFGTDLPEELPKPFRPIAWEHAREMASNGIEIGAHSVSHPFLSRISKSSDLDFEIVGSKRRAEEQLNRRVKHFCYPTGSVEDVGPEAVDAVMRCGFLTGVCSELGFVPAQANPYFLPRFAVDATDPKLFFARTVSGYRAPRPRGISASRAAVERMEPVQMARSGAKAD